MTISLYNVNSDVNQIDRSVGNGVTYTGVPVDPVDNVNPSILIEDTLEGGFNYAFCNGFWYWVNSFTVEREGLTRVDMTRDPLKSFASDIKKLPAIAARVSGEVYNSYLHDPLQRLNASDQVGVYVLHTFSYGNGYILVTAG